MNTRSHELKRLKLCLSRVSKRIDETAFVDFGGASMVNTASFAQVPFVSVGYSSANIINYDLQRFGQQALSVNEGDTLKINELRKGFNIGLGYQYTDINSDINGYFRGGLNYSWNIGKVFKTKMISRAGSIQLMQC